MIHCDLEDLLYLSIGTKLCRKSFQKIEAPWQIVSDHVPGFRDFRRLRRMPSLSFPDHSAYAPFRCATHQNV